MYINCIYLFNHLFTDVVDQNTYFSKAFETTAPTCQLFIIFPFFQYIIVFLFFVMVIYEIMSLEHETRHKS